MTFPAPQLQASSDRLSTWLNVWRILYLIFGGLGLLVLLGVFAAGLYSGAAGLPADTAWAVWLLLLPALLLGFSLWAAWMLLTWGKEWVDRATSLALHGGGPQRLQALDSTLGKWLMGIVWAYLTFYALIILGIGLGVLLLGSTTFPEGLAIAAIILPILAIFYLVGTYFPLTALRRFLGNTTARLSGQAMLLKEAADRLNTWCIVLIVFQVLGLLVEIPGLFVGEDSLGAVGGLFALLVGAAVSLLYILPLLATGRYARDLGTALDQTSGTGGVSAAAAPAADYSQMGRLADQGEIREK
ncbi:hypothetical protein [Deinococcus sp. Marseille-Q6407]|uniref:hypothetical protein n=1 Tax=Deinococcus sp. Marseille-Q6407 TaxID=2969223 RepID=UPI0021C233A0|nr:hypothetical protein [Deinococcus sp. Marseille-Q6407]